MADQPTTVTEPGQDEKLLAALSYLWLLSIVILLIKRNSSFVQFHARQGLVLCIVSVVAWFLPILNIFLNLAIFVVIVLGFIQALNGARWRMPVVADLAEKIRL